MEIIEASIEEYNHCITKPYHVFGSGNFSKLNSSKVEEVNYLLFWDGKVRLGITGGIKENTFLAPFSAPFGGLTYLREDIKIEHIDNACQEITKWAQKKSLKAIEIKLPPTIYNESFISKQMNCFFRHGYTISNIDINYSFNTEDFSENYMSTIWYNARRNLKIGLQNKLQIFRCNTENEKLLAYSIIKKNREAKGFPLRMSWEQVNETTKLINADFFICYDQYENPIASTIAFYVSSNIVQIIYWGDLPEYSSLKTMNFMAYKMFEYYKNTGIKIVDIGPSSENSMPNYGLCEFKESIGCQISPKHQFRKTIYED